MNNFDVFPKKSLLFAPMEGITDEPYRIALMKTFPEWDQFFTDFLRVPTVGKVTEKMIIEHYKIFITDFFSIKSNFTILFSVSGTTL